MDEKKARGLKKRQVTTIVSAVSREIAYGGDGRLFYQQFHGQTRLHKAHFQNHISERTVDRKEAVRVSILMLCGISNVRDVTRDVSKLLT